ncbi:MAG: SCO family protein [Bacteriovoracaceae bacterium]
MTTTTAPEYLRQGNMLEKIIRHWAFWVVFLVAGFSYPIYRSIYRTLPPELPIIAHVPEFTLTSENNQPFGSKDLKDRIYLANFVFASCPSVCPKMLMELEKIQNRVRGTGRKVAIVTFTVDPDHDKPHVLFDLARKHKASPFTWTFLTGTDKAALFKLYNEGFKVPAEQSSTNLFDIAHSQKIVLVDQENRIRGYYDFDKDSVNQLMIDVGLLINRPITKE